MGRAIITKNKMYEEFIIQQGVSGARKEILEVICQIYRDMWIKCSKRLYVCHFTVHLDKIYQNSCIRTRKNIKQNSKSKFIKELAFFFAIKKRRDYSSPLSLWRLTLWRCCISLPFIFPLFPSLSSFFSLPSLFLISYWLCP